MEISQHKTRRVSTPQRKFAIVNDIEWCTSIREGSTKHGIPSSMFYKWKRHLVVVYLPTAGHLANSDLTEHECCGIMWHRIKGRLQASD